MKNTLIILSFLLLALTPAAAQQSTLTSFQGTLLDTVRVNVHFGLDGLPDPEKKKPGSDCIAVIGSFRNDANMGRIEFRVITDSIRLTGEPESIANIQTPVLFNALADAAIRRGIARGFVPTPDCQTPYSTNTYAPACVDRVGAGIRTQFIACDAQAVSTWKFSICQASTDTNARVALIPTENPTICNADAGCEPTYRALPGDGGYLQ